MQAMKPNKSLIEFKVAKFRADNGLGPSEPIHMQSLLLKLNILTLFRPLSENFSGMCLKDGSGHKFMLINSNQSRARQHFTIAHEFYHLCVEENPKPHKCNPGSPTKDPSEQNADLFAATLLMPTSGLFQFIPDDEQRSKRLSIATILKLEHYYVVSRTALLYRLVNTGLLTEERRAELAAIPVKASAQNFGYSTTLYEKANEGLVIGDFGEKARLLFEQEKISEGHYLELLNKITCHDSHQDPDRT